MKTDSLPRKQAAHFYNVLIVRRKCRWTVVLVVIQLLKKLNFDRKINPFRKFKSLRKGLKLPCYYDYHYGKQESH